MPEQILPPLLRRLNFSKFFKPLRIFAFAFFLCFLSFPAGAYEGLDLTHNETRVAEAIAEISQYPMNEQMQELIILLDNVPICDNLLRSTAYNYLSGSFYANVLSAAAANNSIEEIYANIERGPDRGKFAWGQGYVSGLGYASDGNVKEDFNSDAAGALAGIDVWNASDQSAKAGLYASFGNKVMKQGDDKADVNSYGGGIYADKNFGIIALKGNLSVAKHNFDAQRKVRIFYSEDGVDFYESDPKSSFDAVSASFDARIEYLAQSLDDASGKIYTEIRYSYFANGRIDETGGDPANLTVKAGSFNDLSALSGVSFSKTLGKLQWYAKLYGGYILAGNRKSAQIYFSQAGQEFAQDIYATRRGTVFAGAGFGAQYAFNDKMSVYAGGDAGVGGNSSSYYANIGFAYKLWPKTKKAELKITDKVVFDKDMSESWMVKGDDNGNVFMRIEIEYALELDGKTSVYALKYDDRIFFFSYKDAALNFTQELKKAGAKISPNQIKDINYDLKKMKLDLGVYAGDLGDMREGVLVKEYAGGIYEVAPVPQEVQIIARDEIIRRTLNDVEPNAVWELKEENGKIRLTSEVSGKLGLKKGSKIYLVNYGNKVFAFKELPRAQRFITELQKEGADGIDDRNLKEIEGVEIRDDIGISAKDIKTIGDTSKGVIVSSYADDVTEVKSVAEEEKIKAAETVNEEKIEDAKERRKKPVIKSYKLNIANFKTNEHELTVQAKGVIRKQAKDIRQYDYKMITVEGHTDAVGGAEANKKLSIRRAKSVYKEFVFNGIPASKIRYVGLGYSIPLDSNDTEEGRAANRRTDIFVE
ncbi:MAG: OmpA family protein [Endomicrobium sp.]|jgi:outer membrane protein OmpA-like peptidoglycan-associated protein|nr:OmpA family protein [Endomicrobium sp.]